MDEKDWLILDVLGTERNITKTAERSYLSQPSLTHRLQQLEKELGIGLFVYRGRRYCGFFPKPTRSLCSLDRRGVAYGLPVLAGMTG